MTTTDDMSDRDVLATGTRLEEFEIEGVLGRGGFGVTYLAYDTSPLKRRVAIKEYLPVDFGTRLTDGGVGPLLAAHAQNYEWGLTRFLDEARMLAGLDHPRIVRVYRVIEAWGTAYTVMAYVEGRSLQETLDAEGPWPEERVRALLELLLPGVEKVHEAGLVHRDIKPANVMLKVDGSPVLIDFGAARQAVGGRSRSVVLTDGYAPNEQYQTAAEDQGRWTDVYALGAVAYRALSGRVPVAAPERVVAAARGRPDPLAPVTAASAGRVSEGFGKAVTAALSVWPEDRPRDVGAWRALLHPPPPPPPPARKVPDTGATGWWRLAGASVVAVALVVAGLAWWAPGAERQRLAAEASRRTASWHPGQVVSDDCNGCPDLVVIPAGDFMMGSPASEEDRQEDEGPQRRVTVSSFALGVTEVTFDEWEACVGGGGCNGYRPDDRGRGKGSHPVTRVSWRHAQAYVSWLSAETGTTYRLPSESEWEYAARAGTTTPFHTGATISTDQANYSNRYGSSGHAPVGMFTPNAFGLYDVHGNVWEWVEDCWHDSYRGAPIDGTAWTVDGDCGRVLRGGSWSNDPRLLRSAARHWLTVGARTFNAGFRVARTLD